MRIGRRRAIGQTIIGTARAHTAKRERSTRKRLQESNLHAAGLAVRKVQCHPALQRRQEPKRSAIGAGAEDAQTWVSPLLWLAMVSTATATPTKPSAFGSFDAPINGRAGTTEHDNGCAQYQPQSSSCCCSSSYSSSSSSDRAVIDSFGESANRNLKENDYGLQREELLHVQDAASDIEDIDDDEDDLFERNLRRPLYPSYMYSRLQVEPLRSSSTAPSKPLAN
jgi:hypothetical protein